MSTAQNKDKEDLVVVHYLRCGEPVSDEVQRFFRCAIRARNDQMLVVHTGSGGSDALVGDVAQTILTLFGLVGAHRVVFVGPDALLFGITLQVLASVM